VDQVMPADLAADLAAVDDATVRLLRTVEGLTEGELRAASLLPGWSRGHVVTHVARHADAMRNLLTWARTGVVTPAYPSHAEREAGIDAGAGRGTAELRADVSASADRLRADVVALPPGAWAAQVQIFDRPPFPAAEVLLRRLVEVELHHVDLGRGYRPEDWPARFANRPLAEPLASFRADRVAWFS
jgi:maleylpyruvate isomerase